MSEPEDKPEPSNKVAVLRPRSASPSAVDSGWDDLLGPSESSSDKPAVERPIFAPPGSKPRVAEPPVPAVEQTTRPSVPEQTPRTSQASASVSGEFVVAERPEPAMPTRFRLVEPPSEPHEDDDPAELTTSRLQVVSGSDTLDDDDADPPARPAPRTSAPAHPPEQPSSLSATPERPDGARKLVWIGGTIAAAAAIAVLVNNSRDGDPTAASTTDEPSGTSARDVGLSDLPDASGTETSTSGAGGTDTGETGDDTEPVVKPKPKPVNPRDPKLIPPGTPEENQKAFLKLPVSIHDGPPIGGIGRSGIHIDEVSTARGRDNTDCDDPTKRFSVSGDEYVNVCFRVVHVREQEWLRVIWEKDGKVTRRGRVRIPDLHAYTTRAYLLLRPEYVGSWKVRIVPEGEDDTDLAVTEFEIGE